MTESQTFSIASIPGDGIGGEVVAAGLRVLDTIAKQSEGTVEFEVTEYPWSSEYYLKNGRYIPEGGLEELEKHDAIYFGAVGSAEVPDHTSLWGLRLAITQPFDQWANIRPVTFLPGVESPLRKADDTELDWIVVRENSEGEYAGWAAATSADAAPATRWRCRPACTRRRDANGSSASRSISRALGT